jgi:hypothetical protein
MFHMGHDQTVGAANLDGLTGADRRRRSPTILDGMLVGGILVWIALHGFLESYPAEFGAFTAVLVGTLIHRALRLWERHSF